LASSLPPRSLPGICVANSIPILADSPLSPWGRGVGGEGVCSPPRGMRGEKQQMPPLDASRDAQKNEGGLFCPPNVESQTSWRRWVMQVKKASRSRTPTGQTARDLMTANPVSLRDDATLPEILAFLTDTGFSAAPVIDDAGQPLGVISRTDIV